MKNLESILLSHLGEFLAFARARLRDPDLAADAVQDSLLKALQRDGQLRDDDSARAWFYRILRNRLARSSGSPAMTHSSGSLLSPIR